MEDQEVMSIAAVEDWFAKQMYNSPTLEERIMFRDVWIGISKELEDRQKQIDILLASCTKLATTAISAFNAISKAVKR